MKIVFFGTPEFVIPVLKTLHQHFTVMAVVTTPDEKVGRQQIVTPSAVKQYALQQGISVLQPDKLDSTFIQRLTTSSQRPDIFIVAAYGKIIPQSILDIPIFGALNIHPSELPKYRGASPIQETILHGDTKSVVTIIKMDAEMDHGPIIATTPLHITTADTFQTLVTKAFQEAANILPKTIENFVNGTPSLQEQDHEKATYCQHITRENGYIDLENPPDKVTIDRMIRAYYPWPGVWGKWQMPNGKWRIIKFLPEKRIQIEGKQTVSIKDFLNGYPQMRDIIEKII